MSSNSTNSREIKKFGFVAFVFFGSLCALGIWMKKIMPASLFGLLSILGMSFIIVPYRLTPVYSAWMKIARFMGRVITILMLTLAYYMVITPSALIKRLFGGIPLPVKPDKSVSSYWVARTEPLQPRERFLKRY